MVMVFAAQTAVTPAGNPVGAPIPVAPVVVSEITGKEVLIHTVVGAEGMVTVLSGVTMMLPVALALPQPPVRGML